MRKCYEVIKGWIGLLAAVQCCVTPHRHCDMMSRVVQSVTPSKWLAARLGPHSH